MKKIVMALVAAITMSATAVAQDENQHKQERTQPNREEMLKQRTEETVKAYGLNETQAAQLLELNRQFADKMGPMGGPRQWGGRDGHRPQMSRGDKQSGDSVKAGEQRQRPSREEMEKRREEMKKNQEAYSAELKKIMTEEQYKAYQADVQKRMNFGHRGGRQGQRARRGSENRD